MYINPCLPSINRQLLDQFFSLGITSERLQLIMNPLFQVKITATNANLKKRRRLAMVDVEYFHVA